MENGNHTSDFILLGLFNHTRTHLFLFVMMLTIVFISLLVNALVILLIHQDHRIHTPMYFLLSELSLMDMMLVFTIVPKMAADYLTGKNSISSADCGLQIFLFLTLAGGECFLLEAMSYDCYVAIFHPLQYPVLMSWQLCMRMILGSWFLGAAYGIMQAVVTLSFPFSKSHEIDHFFCEAPTLLRLPCADTFVFEYVMYICCVLMLKIPISLILTSYSLILLAVLHMQSTEVRKKAFTTCSSHLAVVGLFYVATTFIYMRPKSYKSAKHDKIASTFYTIFIPALNPHIYSMRNSDVKRALTKCKGLLCYLKS